MSLSHFTDKNYSYLLTQGTSNIGVPHISFSYINYTCRDSSPIVSINTEPEILSRTRFGRATRTQSNGRARKLEIRYSRDLVRFVSWKDLQHVRRWFRECTCHLAMRCLSLFFAPSFFFSIFLSLPLFPFLFLPFAVTRQKLVACLAKCSPVPCPWSSSF